MRRHAPLVAACFLSAAASVMAQEPPVVGPVPHDAGDGRPGHIITTTQLIRPAGQTLEIDGRPVDLVRSPDGSRLFVKDNKGLLVVDAQRFELIERLPFERSGGSMTGVAVSADGRRVYATNSTSVLYEAAMGDEGRMAWARRIALPARDGTGSSFPCGVALSPDGRRAYVCLSLNNALGVVDLERGELERQIPVGIAPFAVRLSPDGRRAYVSNWGGRAPSAGELTAPSGGTPVLVDTRGVAASGTVSAVDLEAGSEVGQVETGLSPSGLVLSADGSRLYVANANSDTITVLDTRAWQQVASLVVRPIDDLPFGSMPNGLALSPDGHTLYAACAGNNAIAVIRIDAATGALAIAGFIPAGWYPGALVAAGEMLYVANVKGVGSRTPRADKPGWNSHGHRGTLGRVAVPDAAALELYTRQVNADARIPQVLRGLERGGAGVEAVPVPARVGEPSVVKHVVYIIKENRTYDQVFGDMAQGNGDPALCIFGREVTPNQHALAEQFVLLDNFYCNGVLSADGHAWATEGNVTPYLERSFGGFTRSYTFGDDPLSYSSSGFVWDHVLARGLSFRNYGEFDYAGVTPVASYSEIYDDWIAKTGRITFTHEIGVERVRRYSCPDYPGWNMDIPDVVRADVFLRELAEFQRTGTLPDFVLIYLPNDHTSGTNEGKPTPRSLVADNDLALGRIVDAITRTRFWPSTAIFVVEDDPQDGFDHVDGHRSIGLVVSPWARRGAVVSAFYNQGSVLHTIQRIFGVAAPNQFSALAPLMDACFTAEPDRAPYTCLPNAVPLCELNPPASAAGVRERRWMEASARLPLDRPDAADEDTLNRILWHAVRGADAPYPAELAGAHGTGLAALGLRLAPQGYVADDEGER